MKNRLISVGIVFALLLGMINMNVFAKDETAFSDQISFLIKLGVLSADGDVGQSTKIKRDRFAKEFTAFINKSDMIDLTKKQEKSYYYDVSLDNQYLPYINYLSENGYMIGDGIKNFRPNEYITNTEMVKCVVEALGYSISMASNNEPTGYLSIAGNLKLTFNIGKLSEEATIESMSQLFYNALDVNIMERSLDAEGGFQINNDITYLEKSFGIYQIKGQVDGNYLTTLGGNISTLLENYVTIDGVKYMLSDENMHLSDYIGYCIEAYYREVGAENEIVAFTNEKSEELVVPAEQIDDFSNYKLYYTIGSESKQRKASIDPNATVIYNGVVAASYTEDMLDNIKNGSVELIRIDNESDYSIVKIYSYNTYITKSFSEESNKIFTKSQRFAIPKIKDTDAQTYEYKTKTLELDKYKYVFIRNATGMKLKISDLKVNDVLSVGESQDGTAVYITVESKAVQGVIESMYENADGNNCLVIAGTEYVMDADCEINTDFVIAAKMQVTAYLSYKGKVATLLFTSANTGEWVYGYMMNIMEDDVNEECMIKIFTAAGKAETYKLREKTIVDGDSKKREELLSRFKTIAIEGSNENSVEPQLIKYKLSGLTVTSIDTASINTSKNESAETSLSEDQPYGSYQFFWSTKQFVANKGFAFDEFNTSIRVGDNTLTFFAPDPKVVGYSAAKSDETLYSVKVGNGYFVEHETYDFAPYDIDFDNGALANVLVTMSGESDKWEENIVISNIENTLDEDDMSCVKIVGYNRGSSTPITYTIKNDVTTFMDMYNKSNSGQKPTATDIIISMNDPNYALKRGDVIRIKTVSGKVSKIRRYFSPSFLDRGFVMEHGIIQSDGTFMGTSGAAADTVMVGVITQFNGDYLNFFNVNPKVASGEQAGTRLVPKRGMVTINIGNVAVCKYDTTSNKLEVIDKSAINEYLYGVNKKAYAYLYTSVTKLETIVIYE